MELPSERACAFVGSNNLTSFALDGLNSEAAVLLEGSVDDTEFEKIRRHIDTVENEATRYTPALKEAFAWWARQYFEGIDAEIKVPLDWNSVRTILIFSEANERDRPDIGSRIYFELPSGIRIESLTTELHLFLFKKLPASPWEALSRMSIADAKYTCRTLGADNEQGNAEVLVNWQIERAPLPRLKLVSGGRYRTSTPRDMQQVRAKVETSGVEPWDYAFEREKVGWDPVFSHEHHLKPSHALKSEVALAEARGGRSGGEWDLVIGLRPRSGSAVESDQAALNLARPDAGSFVLVSLRRRLNV
ncbi:MAG: hypothetical protein ABSC06_21440, partial [Rhodopila sp.]